MKSWMAPFMARSRRLPPPSSLPSMAGLPGAIWHSPGGESGRGAPVPAKRRHLEEPFLVSGSKPVS